MWWLKLTFCYRVKCEFAKDTEELYGFGFQVMEDDSTNPGYIFFKLISCNTCCETAVNLCHVRS